jgi:hypothetical protein
MNTCGNKDIACMAQSVPFGPSTPGCDNYFKSRCNLYEQHMHGLRKTSKTCMNYDVGKEYICHQVGVPAGKKCDCFNQSPSALGVHYICEKPQRQRQCGGSDQTQPPIRGVSKLVGQHGGGGGLGLGPQGVSIFDPLVDINDPMYDKCETVVHLRSNIYDGPVYGNIAKECGLRTNYTPSAQPGLDVSLVKPQIGITSGVKSNDLKLCNGKERCGNVSFCVGENGCEKLKPGMPSSCLWDNRVITSPWVYGASDIPSYSLDLAGPMIAGTPQWKAGTNNSIPPMMLLNSKNLADKEFGCRQPCWLPNCS